MSNPLTPAYLSGFQTDNALKLAMNEGSKVLYICNGTNQFQTVNVTDPLRPKIASYTSVPNANIFDLAVINRTLIAACGAKGLVVFNLEKPGNPLRVKRFEVLKAANRLCVDPAGGTLVAVADGDLGLALVNFATWKTPVLKGSLAFATQSLDAQFLPNQDRVVVALGAGGYAVVDVTDPTHPWHCLNRQRPHRRWRLTPPESDPYLLCSGSGLFRWTPLTRPTR